MATSHLALAAENEALRQQFEQLSADGAALVAPLSDAQFSWKPIPGVWSMAQCFDHLNVSARLYLPCLDEGIAEGIRRGLHGEGPFTYNWIGRLLVRSVEPPPRFRVKAPRMFHPAATPSRPNVMAAFSEYQVQFIDRLHQANGLDLSRARVRSPVSAWLRMPLGSGFALMAAHERRHLLQARKLLDHPGFRRE